MSNRPPSPKFAEIIPTGVVAAICGIGAISMLSKNLIIACFVGAIGSLAGTTTLRMHVEKLDKISAMIGIILSFIPMIYAIVILALK